MATASGNVLRAFLFTDRLDVTALWMYGTQTVAVGVPVDRFLDLERGQRITRIVGMQMLDIIQIGKPQGVAQDDPAAPGLVWTV